ncbi:MAG: acetyl-CoA carboxylase carboxyltransferase subunit alpha [Phycisphaerae bacterium]|nr:acetyl-CoA carboxylase carboxyltransferase subunit alpha [Phycisphaerae bacterium]MBT5582504.1 acetyl-CoA carboxylase carboxyltransferase subunit alpha [Phycisphaerae bacterium]MBT5656755.1 acetyl-CoA carboxylase carboxyltransferase subunit alpha [Phycisphaerae bacterium]
MDTAAEPVALPFEAPLVELDAQIRGLESRDDAEAFAEQIASLRQNREDMLDTIFAGLAPVDVVKVARHPNRPQTADYINAIFRDFRELHGDRRFGDDPAIITGFGRIGPYKVLVVGHQKGRTTEERIKCHFGCAHPEGYRKALAKMKLAEKFNLPIVTIIDTPGAYPGMGPEERGQAEAIAVSMRDMSRLKTPIVSVVIGEGGSGGALGIAVADRVDMMQYAWYSVISPEGCAAILWKEANEETNAAAANALSLTAKDNLANGIIDRIIEEPRGGAHRDPADAAARLERHLVDRLGEVTRLNPRTLVESRYEKFRRMGSHCTE